MIHSKGKLLMTGEYLVLDGATALALPTKLGQSLTCDTSTATVKKDLFADDSSSPGIIDEDLVLTWKSYDHENQLWFNATFDLKYLSPQSYSDFHTALQVSRLLQSCRGLNPSFLPVKDPVTITTHLEFPRHWGLGSSSTLTANMAKLSKTDALTLHFGCFKGSGYDVAVGMAEKPVLYTLFEGKPIVEPAIFNPSFKRYLWFVYSGDKQSSASEVSKYNNRKHISPLDIYRVSDISNHLLKCQDLHEFEDMLKEHEAIVAKVLDRPNIKTERFYDYPHTIKSLGAWGGDFMMVTGDENDIKYFHDKGLKTIFSFEELIDI